VEHCSLSRISKEILEDTKLYGGRGETTPNDSHVFVFFRLVEGTEALFFPLSQFDIDSLFVHGDLTIVSLQEVDPIENLASLFSNVTLVQSPSPTKGVGTGTLPLSSPSPALGTGIIPLTQKKSVCKSIQDCSKSIQLNPNDSDFWYSRGDSYCMKGEYDKPNKRKRSLKDRSFSFHFNNAQNNINFGKGKRKKTNVDYVQMNGDKLLGILMISFLTPFLSFF